MQQQEGRVLLCLSLESTSQSNQFEYCYLLASLLIKGSKAAVVASLPSSASLSSFDLLPPALPCPIFKDLFCNSGFLLISLSLSPVI